MRIEFHAKFAQKEFLVEFAGYFVIRIPEKNLKKQFMFFIAHTGSKNQRIIVWKDDSMFVDVAGNDLLRLELEAEKKALFHIVDKLIIKRIIEILEIVRKIKQRLEDISVMSFSGNEFELQSFIDPNKIIEIRNASKSKNPEFQEFICKACL